MEKKRIIVCEFHQETNTFNPVINPLNRFNAGDVFEGEEIFAKRMQASSAVHGGVDAITEAGGEVIPTVFMDSVSLGRVVDEAFELMKARMQYYIETVGEFDGVYAALHGATCTVSLDDTCGEFLKFLRRLVGDKPIAVSCDLHGKITDTMLENADFICGYQTYPHVDFYETGYRAAKLCMEKLAGKTHYRAAVHVPMLVPPAGYTTSKEPLKSLAQKGKTLVADGVLEDYSIFVVQPWLDVNPIASTVLTVADDPETAKKQANILAQELLAMREEMWPEMYSVDEIIDFAEKNEKPMPVILGEPSDSPNGGAMGDSPVVAMRLQARGSQLKSAVFIRDEKAVEKAFSLGVGATAEFSIGAGWTPDMPGPFVGEGIVVGLYENEVTTAKFPHVGAGAAIAFGNLTIIACVNGTSAHYPDIYREFGVEPTQCDLLVAKANTSFRAHYAPLSDLIMVADTPGPCASNLKQLKWHNVPKGLYPFDLPEDYTLPEAKLW